MICGLHTILFVVWHCGTIPSAGTLVLVVSFWKGKEDVLKYNYHGNTLLSVKGVVLSLSVVVISARPITEVANI